jgi:hypothetical protein
VDNAREKTTVVAPTVMDIVLVPNRMVVVFADPASTRRISLAVSDRASVGVIVEKLKVGMGAPEIRPHRCGRPGRGCL